MHIAIIKPQSDNTPQIIIIIRLNKNAIVLLKAVNIEKRKYQSTAILDLKIEVHCNIDLLVNL